MTQSEEEKRETRKREEEPFEITRLDKVFQKFLDEFEDTVRALTPLQWKMPFLDLRVPPCDCVDQGDRYVITMEVPGFEKEQIGIDVRPHSVEVKAEIKAEEEEKGKRYLYKERKYKSFHRYVDLPEEVVPSKGEAKMKNGILEIVIPKKSPKPEEKPVKLEVKSS